MSNSRCILIQEDAAEAESSLTSWREDDHAEVMGLNRNYFAEVTNTVLPQFSKSALSKKDPLTTSENASCTMFHANS